MSTYSTPPPDDAPDQPYDATASGPITPAQVDTIVHSFQVLAWPPERVRAWLQAGWGVPRVKLLSTDQAAQVIQALVAALAAWAAEDAAAADFADLAPVLGPTAPVTAAQVEELEGLRQAAGMNDFHLKNFLQKHWRVDRLRSLNQDQYTGCRQLLLQRQPNAATGQGRDA
jgi:hypothetical protein